VRFGNPPIHALVVLTIVTPLLLLAACAGGTDRPGDTPAPPTAGPAVSLARTGGLAGVDDQVVIASDGTWSATDRAGTRRTGSLSDQQRATLARLADDSGLTVEAAQTREPTRCADAYAYAVTVRTVRVSFVDCPTDADLPPVASSIVQLVKQAVWD
jgi:hypothetical protein